MIMELAILLTKAYSGCASKTNQKLSKVTFCTSWHSKA